MTRRWSREARGVPRLGKVHLTVCAKQAKMQLFHVLISRRALAFQCLQSRVQIKRKRESLDWITVAARRNFIICAAQSRLSNSSPWCRVGRGQRWPWLSSAPARRGELCPLLCALRQLCSVIDVAFEFKLSAGAAAPHLIPWNDESLVGCRCATQVMLEFQKCKEDSSRRWLIYLKASINWLFEVWNVFFFCRKEISCSLSQCINFINATHLFSRYWSKDNNDNVYAVLTSSLSMIGGSLREFLFSHGRQKGHLSILVADPYRGTLIYLFFLKMFWKAFPYFEKDNKSLKLQ